MAVGRRGQHRDRVPAAAAVPPAVAGADRPGPLPPGRHPDPHLAGRRHRRAARHLRRHLGRGGVAQLPAVAQRRPVRPEGRLLRARHRLLRLRAALAALPRRLRHGGRDRRRCSPPRSSHYLYGGIRLQTPGDRLTGAAQAQLSVLLGVFVLAKAADYWLDRYDLVHQTGLAAHRHHLHRRQRGAAGQVHPDGHRADLRGAVLPQRVAAHLAAAVDGPRAARRSPRSCSA